jgi:hypothetical protein
MAGDTRVGGRISIDACYQREIVGRSGGDPLLAKGKGSCSEGGA